MKLIADLHTHTLASGHAYGTIRENALAAAEQGLSILGVTEHAPGIPGTCDEFYYCNLKSIPRIIHGVQMLFGSEVNVLNDGSLSLDEIWLQRLDYAIAGIHTLCYRDEGRQKNTENLISCMRHEKVKIVSHPDDDHTPLDYEQLIQAAKEYHVALEVNNSSLIKAASRLNCYENYHTMLSLCSRYGVNVVIDSDAHDPWYVGKFQKAMELIAREGFDESLILNTSEEKVFSFLGCRKRNDDTPDMGI